MKRILYYIAVAVLLICIGVLPSFATEAVSAQEAEGYESEAETALDETGVVIDGEGASELVGIIEDSENRSDVILAIVEKYGCTVGEAEEILDAFITLGDKYLGDSALWVGFKRDIQENTQFWVMAIMCAAAILVIIGGIFVLLGKTNPTLRRAMFGMTDALKLSEKQLEANSQTLVKLERLFAEAVAKEEHFEKIIAEKEEKIALLTEQIETSERANEKERRNMLLAEAYNLRMLKLICDRTAMPITDKSTIDLWYAKGIDSIKDELNAEDIQKIESMSAMLDATGGGENGKG